MERSEQPSSVDGPFLTERFQLWIEYGIRHNYISEVFCLTHEEIPLTTAEYLESDITREVPCLMSVRVFPEVVENAASTSTKENHE